MAKEYDYIIVGQGIAGSCLAHALEERFQRILVINNNKDNSASKIAGGLFNPITGRNMVLTWKANVLFSTLVDFYKLLEKKLNKLFLHTIPLYRPFSTLREQNEWQGKSVSAEYVRFVKSISQHSLNLKYINDYHGGLLLNETGYLDVASFISAYAEYLLGMNRLRDEVFDLTLMKLEPQKVVYKDYTAKMVIFCEGPKATSNVYFNAVKFRPLKGEILVIDPKEVPKWIISKSVFMIPKSHGVIVGSTYDRTDLTWQITNEARKELEQKMHKVYSSDYSVVDQQAGIRPTVIDRRPVIGIHPNHSQIGIFNGLGTKGVSLGPYYSRQFASHLVDGSPLDKEVNVARFF